MDGRNEENLDEDEDDQDNNKDEDDEVKQDEGVYQVRMMKLRRIPMKRVLRWLMSRAEQMVRM